MTYLRLDDNMPGHPKVIGLSDGAFRLYVAGLCYSARHLTDGVIPVSQVPILTPAYRKTHLAELTDRALWAPIADGKWYEIHDYLDWNFSRETVQKRRDMASRAARKRWGDQGGWIG